MIIITISACESLYMVFPGDKVGGRQSAQRAAKNDRYLPWLAVYSYLIGPICQFAPSMRGSGSVLAPTRFSEAHTAPDIAGIMEQAE